MAAAKAVLLEVLTPAAYRHLDELRDELAERVHHVLGRHRIPGYVSAYGAKGAVVFSPVRIRDYRDFCRLRRPLRPRPLAVPAQRRRVPAAVGEDGAVDALRPAHRRRHRPRRRQPRALRRGTCTDDASDARRSTTSLGQVGLPAPLAELTGTVWDVVVVGGGHNGLTCAAYLAKAGRSVLVLERRDRLGGACTLEQPFADPGYAVSPCAYVVGLLDQRVIDELELRRHGYKVFVAEPLIWCPFDDGTWYAQFLDPERTVAGMRENGFSEADIKGQFEYEDFFDRHAPRPARGRARHVGRRLARRGRAARAARPRPRAASTRCSRTSVADVIDRHVSDPRLQQALYGQGVIGAWAGPRTPGTASIKLMHFQGTLEGVPMAWGYVEGGMGRISFAIAEAAREAGAAAGRRASPSPRSARARASCSRAAR